MKQRILSLIPRQILELMRPAYHRALAHLAAVYYGFPSRRITVIAVTGTKGKSSVTEMIGAILKAAGKKAAVSSTIHFEIAGATERNLFKMTMPGRFFMQSFLKRAADSGCTHAVIEMTSEGAKLWRHAMIELDALVFTNLAPEHIESHGSFENYLNAKLRLRDALAASPKPQKVAVANLDDEYGALFLEAPGARKIGYRIADAAPWSATDAGIEWRWHGRPVASTLKGEFTIRNMLAAATVASAFGIPDDAIVAGLQNLGRIRGRGEEIDEGQPFRAVVDYAHTPDSLEALYAAYGERRKICVLGNTGGGRDTWKRPQMGAIAAARCAHVILTNEDPYDEDPAKIVFEMAAGMGTVTPEIIMDRRDAIRRALSLAEEGSAVLISGKGTDPFIMGPNGSKEPWDDAQVVREELRALAR